MVTAAETDFNWRIARPVILTVIGPAINLAAEDLANIFNCGIFASISGNHSNNFFLRVRGGLGGNNVKPSLRAALVYRLEIGSGGAVIYSQRESRPGWDVIHDLPVHLFTRRYKMIVGMTELKSSLSRRIITVQLLAMLRYAFIPEERDRLRQLEIALSLLESDLEAGWKMQELAAHVRMTASAFSKHFRSILGCSPHSYFDLVRTAMAHRLLHHSDRPFAHIAYALGYSSQAHFISAFGRQTGTTPGVYRAQVQNQIH